jgi:hypothetical protein
MRYLKTYRLFEAAKTGLTSRQETFLNTYTDGSWTYDPATGLVNVDGDADYRSNFAMSFYGGKSVNFYGIRFGKVTGFFDCSRNNIINLEGCPEEVGDSFFCSHNQLTSLQGGPKVVGMDYECANNNLVTLEGSPEEVIDFDCCFNNLTNLEGAPKKVKGLFQCYGNPDMTSLKGAPLEIDGLFECDAFRLNAGQWNIEGWLSVLNHEFNREKARQLVTPLLTPEVLNPEIQKDPAGMAMKLKEIWNNEDFRETREKLVWPKEYEIEAHLLGDLDDVGF